MVEQCYAISLPIYMYILKKYFENILSYDYSAMSVSLLEHQRNEILEEARVEPIAMARGEGSMVRAREKKRRNWKYQRTCRNEAGWVAHWRTQVEVEGYCQKGHGSLEVQGGMGH